MSTLMDPNKFEPIKIVDKGEVVGQTSASVSITLVLSRKPEFDWTEIFGEESRGVFGDVSFRISADRLTIQLGDPKLLEQVHSWIKDTVLPKTNNRYHVKIEGEWNKQKGEKQEIDELLKRGQDELDKLEL